MLAAVAALIAGCWRNLEFIDARPLQSAVPNAVSILVP
jgi:hypothetical protein